MANAIDTVSVTILNKIELKQLDKECMQCCHVQFHRSYGSWKIFSYFYIGIEHALWSHLSQFLVTHNG